MNKLKTKNLWKAANVFFDQDEMIAVSYNWWVFVRVINNQVVFNNYAYSNTTIKHQYKVRRLLAELGINIDLFVSTPLCLTNSSAIGDSIQRLENDITQLHADMIDGQTKRNAERAIKIEELRIKQEEIARRFHMELAA